MKYKFLLGFAVIGLSLVSAKSYEISVDSVSKAGDVSLQPGLYKVSVTGNTVKFTNENSGKSVETNATVESNGKTKFDSTALETQMVNGGNTIQEIDLGGTTNKIKFQ
jgi:plastocyanin